MVHFTLVIAGRGCRFFDKIVLDVGDGSRLLLQFSLCQSARLSVKEHGVL